MTDQPQPIELESAKDPSLSGILDRLREAGVDVSTAELRMGYIRTSTPLLGDIRAAGVIAIDDTGRVGEVVHMPLDDLDPITLDEDLVVDEILRDDLGSIIGARGAHELAHRIISRLRAGTTPAPAPKEA